MKKKFGVLPEGKEVFAFTIASDSLELTALDFGATLQDIRFEGLPMILNYPSLEAYFHGDSHQGALTGRNAGRISNGVLEIDGAPHPLAQNNRTCNIHGGKIGFNKRMWAVKAYSPSSLEFVYHSPSGEEGFPGSVDISVRYTVEGSSLSIEYYAECSEKTLINPTQHAYFNLSGKKQDILGHMVRIDAQSFAALGGDFAPQSPAPIEHTPFDFRSPKLVGQDIFQPHPQLQQAGGYDHPFFLSQTAPQISAFCPESGISLDISTDQEAAIFYTGNFLKGDFLHRQGLCFETQNCSNAALYPELSKRPVFTSPETPYRQRTVWKFSKK